MVLYHNLVQKIFDKCNLQMQDRIRSFLNMQNNVKKIYMMSVFSTDSRSSTILLSIGNNVEDLYRELDKIMNTNGDRRELYNIRIDEIELNRVVKSFTPIMDEEIKYDDFVYEFVPYYSDRKPIQEEMKHKKNVEVMDDRPNVPELNYVSDKMYYTIVLVDENIKRINKEVRKMKDYKNNCNRYRDENGIEHNTYGSIFDHELPIKRPETEYFFDYYEENGFTSPELTGETLLPLLFGYDDMFQRRRDRIEEMYSVSGEYYYFMTDNFDNVEYNIRKVFPNKIMNESIIYCCVEINKSSIYGDLSIRTQDYSKDYIDLDKYLPSIEEKNRN